MTAAATATSPTRPPLMLLCTSLAHGGAEIQVSILAQALHARGWPVVVVSLLPPNGLAGGLQAGGIPVHSLGMRPGHLNLAGFVRLALLLRRLQPAILHTHLFHANLLARCLRTICPVPVLINTIHSLAESSQRSARSGMRDWAYRLTDSYATSTVCVSHAVAERHLQAKAVSARRIRVIGNAADPQKFHPDADTRAEMRGSLGLDDSFTWLSVGRLMWKKDFASLITAMALLGEGHLLIAGDGPQRQELEDRARALGANVTFLGLRQDIGRLMKACDGFVLSSVVEGLPMVLIEAAMSGLPCVATRVGGVPEIFPVQEHAHLTPPQDSQALATAMRDLMEMPPAARQAASQRFRAHALEHYAVDVITAQWEQLYLQLLAEAAQEIRA